MKKILTVAALLCMMSTVNAQDSTTSCADVAELAVEIMQKRQVNYDIMLLINTMNDELFDRPGLLNLMQPMIDKAYSEALATTADTREAQVTQFKDFWVQRCEASEQ